MKSIVPLSSLLLVGIFLVLTTLPQIAFAQAIGINQMISQMRFTHSQLLGDINQIQQSVPDPIIPQKPLIYLMTWTLKLIR